MTTRPLTLTFAAVLTALVTLAVATSGAASPPAGSTGELPELAFARANDLFAIRQDSTGLRRLTAHRALDGQPAWSPDGRRIAFVSYRDGDAEIYVADATGRNVHRLTRNTAEDGQPDWSPDGRRIAFTSNRTGGYELYVVPASRRGSATRLTRGATPAYGSHAPAWSPDGRLIAFSNNAWTPENAEIYVIRANGTDRKRLTRTKGDSETLGDDGTPDWSPDGRTIVFTSNRTGEGDIWTMRADGTRQRRLTGWGGRDDDNAVFSPDGTRIAFETRRGGRPFVYLVGVNGGTRTLLAFDAEAPSWRP